MADPFSHLADTFTTTTTTETTTTIEDERELLEISVKTEPIKRVLPPRNIQPPKASDHINVGNEIFMPVQIPEPHVCDPSVPITREKF